LHLVGYYHKNIFFGPSGIKYHYEYIKVKVKGRGKAIPLQAWTGREGSRRLRLPDFKTIST
jgi:hypothetical protein